MPAQPRDVHPVLTHDLAEDPVGLAAALLQGTIRGEDIPLAWMDAIADAALDLPGAGPEVALVRRDASLVLSGDPRALAAAIRLAGRLVRAAQRAKGETA